MATNVITAGLIMPLFCLAVSVFSRPASGQAPEPAALIVKQDTVLDPSRTYGRIVIAAPNITVDGQGAWLVGPGKGDPNSFAGVAVTAHGVTGFTLKNINAKGWETGLHLVDVRGCVVEGCNFSDNFHDPKFGWGENGRRGGLVLERVTHGTFRKNRANRVWDGCVLVESDDNLLEDNDFSHTSNTCLKLWTASRNTVRRNNLSYGIRIDPGEVHARDSTSVLMESGSNDNQFTGNDCTHGGDGIFVRVLNGWVSTGNVFTENDCSHANNNCVEAWSPRNTWIRNKANHGSYGFWLGASDQNVLVGNEASYNGLADGPHNSPHLPDGGHAGIVFMFGPSSHTVLRENTCVGNHGAGIAAIGDIDSKGRKWKAFHWVVDRNTLTGNRWGIYLQHAEQFDLAANRFMDNQVADVFQAETVAGLVVHESPSAITVAPRAILDGPTVVAPGQPVNWSASASSDTRPLSYRWRLVAGDANGMTPVSGDAVGFTHTFLTPGFHRLALTVNNGLLSDLAWRDVYVVEAVTELGTEGSPAVWTWVDDASTVRFSEDKEVRLIGESSLRADVNPYGGGRVTLRQRMAPGGFSLAGKTHLEFWIKTRNEGIPGWQDLNPLVTLHGPGGTTLRLPPVHDFLSQPPYNEARDGWARFSIPLAGNTEWKREGDDLTAVESIDLGFDSWGAPPLVIWLDGLGLK